MIHGDTNTAADAQDAMDYADSFARLGGAVAVTLVAAIQRPTQKAMGRGAVRSQMNADLVPRPRAPRRQPDPRSGHAQRRMARPHPQRPRQVPHLLTPVRYPKARLGLFRLDPADQVLPADRIQQGRMVGSHVPPDHPDHLVIAIATGHEPAFASDQLHPHTLLLWLQPQHNARMLA